MTTITKVHSGVIRLPKKLQRSWQGAEVFVLPGNDTLVVKRVQKSSGKLSEVAKRISARRLTAKAIEREVGAYRRRA